MAVMALTDGILTKSKGDDEPFTSLWKEEITFSVIHLTNLHNPQEYTQSAHRCHSFPVGTDTFV